MSEIAKKGRQYFESGYSCSESTWLALNQEDLPQEMLDFGLQLAGGFAGGFASGNVCGAISGIVLSLGRKYGRKMGEERSEILRQKVKQLMDYTEKIFHSVHCHEMRPEENYRSFCADLIEILIEYAETLFEE